MRERSLREWSARPCFSALAIPPPAFYYDGKLEARQGWIFSRDFAPWAPLLNMPRIAWELKIKTW